MATIVVCSKNFAFGPTGKLLTIIKPFIENGHKVIFIGSGTAYQLASKEKFYKTLNIDPKDPYFAYFTHMLIKQADLVISAEKRMIELAQRFGIKNIFIDTQFWYRDKMSDEALNADLYLIQKSFDHRKNLKKYRNEFKNAHIVEPIVDLSKINYIKKKKRQLIISLGGMDGGSLYKVGRESHYPHVMLSLLAKYGSFEQFDRVLVTGNEKVLEKLSPKLTKINSKFVLKLLPHSEFLKQLAQSSLIMLAPGFETILEAFAYGIPTIFLPPSNDSQYLHLNFLRQKKATCMSIHFADYYPRLIYRGNIKNFFAHYLEQLHLFEQDKHVQKVVMKKINQFVNNKQLHKKQLQLQTAFINELGTNGQQESIEIISNDTKSIEGAKMLKEAECIAQWRSTAQAYVSAEEKDGTKMELCSSLLRQELGPVKGQTILDYGCGEGWFSRELEQLGAAKVIGIDLLPEMIELAKYKTKSSRVHFYHTPTNSLSFLSDNSVDKIVANLVFMLSPNMHWLKQSFNEIFRVLKPGGQFVYLITHPVFLDRPFHNTQRIFSYGKFNYMERGLKYDVYYRSHRGHETVFQSYHYPLEAYLESSSRSGFFISHSHEIIPSISFLKRYGFSKELLTYPQLFLSSVEKPRILLQ